jgi:hypothetical protein
MPARAGRVTYEGDGDQERGELITDSQSTISSSSGETKLTKCRLLSWSFAG